ncbi:MAG: 50S ribosomal protein L24 [Bdellovibrionota bacterium]
MKIKKGDTVQVIAGSSKGKAGKVTAVYPEDMKIVVEGVNIRKKHSKPTQANPKGGIVEKELPINYSNVMLLDSKGKPSRIGIKRVEKNGKLSAVRYAKSSGEELA